MVLLTVEEYKHRKGCILKAHLWFGSDVLGEVFKDFDYYYSETMVHVFYKSK